MISLQDTRDLLCSICLGFFAGRSTVKIAQLRLAPDTGRAI